MLRAFGLAALALAFTNSAWAQQRSSTLRLATATVQSTSTSSGSGRVTQATSTNRAATGTQARPSTGSPTRRSDATAQPAATQMMPFTAQSPWLHGFGTRQPVFSGLYRFRPTNYKQALARDSYLRVHGASERNQFWAKYQSVTPPAKTRSLAIRPVETEPRLISAQTSVTKIKDGMMSPIHSIQMAVPRRLDLSQATQPGPVRHAIQREQTGPLFPLPR